MSDIFNNWFLDIVPDSGQWTEGIPPPPPLLPASVEVQSEEPKEQPTPEVLIEKANARLERVVIEGRMSYFKKFTSHLKYSEIDLSVSIDEFRNGKCPIKDIDCVDWDKKKKLEAEAQSASPRHNIKRKFDTAFSLDRE
ncbi:unnamed protein product [Clonostachys byssicola]|uniref:Uncharacterized protein n=1 Tax=Clonostachys byssicola TaxID=160290 RepID=A0A9N9UKE5_9HYPO|nr:unnamed protein product [Clonostachys byssicola]